MKLSALAVSLLFTLHPAHAAAPWAAPDKPFVWENATVYFLLTDRFNNGNPDNDHAYGRRDDAATLRGFMGATSPASRQRSRRAISTSWV
jgi:alpha-amylase